MTVSMDLDEHVAELGGQFSGRLWREPDTDGITKKSSARAVKLALRWRTEGRGDTDRKVVDEATFETGTHGGLDVMFSLQVPTAAPISYDGSLIRVVWEIEARIDLKLARDPKTERGVLVLPTGGFGVYESAHPLSLRS